MSDLEILIIGVSVAVLVGLLVFYFGMRALLRHEDERPTQNVSASDWERVSRPATQKFQRKG